MNQNESAFPIIGEKVSTKYGLTKLEYFVAHNIGAAVNLTEGLTANQILERLNCTETYDFEKHYSQYLAKIQISLAKELLKQLENESNN